MVLGALASGALFAQSAAAGTTQAPAANGMAPAGKAPMAVTRALSAQDRKFVAIAGEAGGAEVEMARIAMERAESSDVKNFASRMVSDHQKAGDELDKIASNKGVKVDDKLSAQDQAELNRLTKLEGASFDREYVKSQLAAHKAAVALFDKESKSGNDSELKGFAASTLPTLQDHLQLVQQLSKSASRAAATPAAAARSTKS
jgi:putative membrane protein